MAPSKIRISLTLGPLQVRVREVMPLQELLMVMLGPLQVRVLMSTTVWTVT